MNKGFTLLEILIAMVVLSVSMTGLYILAGQSVSINDYSKQKLELITKSYERIVLNLAFPRRDFSEKDFENANITFETSKSQTMLPGIQEVRLRTSNGETTVEFVYYER